MLPSSRPPEDEKRRVASLLAAAIQGSEPMGRETKPEYGDVVAWPTMDGPRVSTWGLVGQPSGTAPGLRVLMRAADVRRALASSASAGEGEG